MTADIVIRKETPRQPDVARLLALSDAYAASLYPSESNHMLPVDALDNPAVSFFVARRGDTVLGCAALVGQAEREGEIKRMYVDSDARGLKLGRRLLEALESEARRRGITVLRLETGIYQPEAIGLYRKAGYRDIEPFGSYQADPLSLFMEKTLAAEEG
ncbi:GNAT family N-acetyltransferase [Rhizobium sp. SSA_523]|uniref:GNAT family N-acetyltransferase n=1 Tax=Rhizobium sp. SSA_523 TaxID=2952477 RepID=UPI002091D140|nr:GNAT family N-acetyltransferase [Rhizobium sp. SSA_523]MCO5733820.1 GNAT family N-acetyltransferase [Rhizobium sp. SSA_523]WKC24908.1 GNAT family N-acetyltransferase [Rhizobium sp. SSA_523]